MSLLSNREVFLIKVEGTYNTDSVPVAATDAVFVDSVGPASEGLRMVQRAGLEANLGTRQHIFGGRLAALQVTAEIKGSGAAGTAPEIGLLLRACGMGETIVPATSVAYSPVSTGHESFTIYHYKDGKLRKYTGVRGNCSVSMEVGNKPMITANLIGHFAGADTDVALPAPTYDTTRPVAIRGGNFQVDSYAAVINALNFDLGNTIATPSDFNSADGYSEVRITKRDVNGSIDPEDTLVATKDFRDDFETEATMALQTGNIGATAGNIMAVTMPAIAYRDENDADRDGVKTKEMPFGAAASSGDDEVTITFT